ncbi:MAG: hypothetical protein WCG27_03030, partial [Pseudomonadota bacterium]
AAVGDGGEDLADGAADGVKVAGTEMRGIEHMTNGLDLHLTAIMDAVGPLPSTGRRLRVALDSCNGAGSLIAPRLLEMLGVDVVPINITPNGSFPRPAEPIPENLGALCEAVKAHQCDVGFAQDMDADRLAVVSELGEPIGEDYTLVLATWHVLMGKMGSDPVFRPVEASHEMNGSAPVFRGPSTPTVVATLPPTVTPTPTSTPLPSPTPTFTPTPTPTPLISEFETTAKKRKEKDLPRLEIKMEQFKKDFTITPKMKKVYDFTLKSYETRQALADMKQFDNLGSKIRPVRLLFLKYLIDFDHHQSLFNIVQVIGAQFWVINDLEDKVSPEYIELKNDKSSHFKWQIFILAPNKKAPQGD